MVNGTICRDKWWDFSIGEDGIPDYYDLQLVHIGEVELIFEYFWYADYGDYSGFYILG